MRTDPGPVPSAIAIPRSRRVRLIESAESLTVTRMWSSPRAELAPGAEPAETNSTMESPTENALARLEAADALSVPNSRL